MDTLYSRINSEKFALICTNLFIAVSIVLSQNMLVFADNVRIVSGIISPPLINAINVERSLDRLMTEERSEAEFNTYIGKKYSNCSVYDVEKGIKHIRLVRYYQGKPVRLNIIEADLSVNKNIKIVPVLASKTLSHKASITSMARSNNSLVAVNGAFFLPQTGCPLGTMMVNKKLYTGPVFNRVAMGISENGFCMDRVKLNASLKGVFNTIKVDNINQPRMSLAYTLCYTPDWGQMSPAIPKNGIQIVVEDGRIVAINKNRNIIPQNGFVVVGQESVLSCLKVNQRLELDVKMSPEWSEVNHVISGGPYLVKDGEVFVDIKEQRLLAIGGRNPRTAVGYTADNRFIIVTADGREGCSVGMTLTELAGYMKKLGCVNAMNLDGGGSTVLYVKGNIANKPPVKGGIALSNALSISVVD